MITPNMDRLVREGLTFEQAYCPGATCIASRAATFTGMYPHTTGVYTFQDWANHRNWVQDLAESGYWCANIGKMHFSPRDVAGGFHDRLVVENPTNNTHANGGADDDWGRYLSWHGVERPNGRHRTDPEWIQKFQGVPWHLDEHLHSDVFIGNAAVAWIDNHRGSGPMFLQIGFTGPHEPWDPLPRHLELYEGRELPKPVLREGELDEKPPQHRAHQDFHANTNHESRIDLRQADAAGIEHMRRCYYAKITTVDEQIGRVIDALERRGFLENSLLIFCSDHGEMLGDHNLAYKWLMYDPIVHVPLVVRTPETAANPRRTSDLVSLIDLGPTILEAAGVEVPAYLEGRSLLPYVREEAIAPREFVFSEDNYQVMMRSDAYKLIYYIGQPDEGDLYDLRADPGELWNRWSDDAYAEVKQRLLLRLLEWFAASTYYNSAYKRNRSKSVALRWPSAGDAYLHGGNFRPKQVDHF